MTSPWNGSETWSSLPGLAQINVFAYLVTTTNQNILILKHQGLKTGCLVNPLRS